MCRLVCAFVVHKARGHRLHLFEAGIKILHTLKEQILSYYFVINQVISYWLSYRSEVSCIGPRPSDNAADKGPVTETIRNHLINDIFIN